MAVKLSADTERRIERLLQATGLDSADELLASALEAFEEKSAFWQRVERLNAEADEDIAAGRHKPVTDEFIARLKTMVTRPGS